jgi:hypothetical protein
MEKASHEPAPGLTSGIVSSGATMPVTNVFGEPHDCSLVLGGPLFQLFREAHLEGDHLELLYWRLIAITASDVV